jgi:multiubiquitin
MADQETQVHGIGAAPKNYRFIVDDNHLESSQPTLTGAQLRTIARIEPSLQLFEEVHGHGADRQINDDTLVTLREDGETRFYTMPSAKMG